MTVRVDKQGIVDLMDPVGVGPTSSGVPIYDDGQRDAPWMDRPWQSKEAYITSEAMRLMAIPGDELAKIRPPVPYRLFPPDQDFDRNALTIEQVLDTDRWAPKQRSWVSPDLTPTPRVTTPDSGDGTARNIGPSMSGPFG